MTKAARKSREGIFFMWAHVCRAHVESQAGARGAGAWEEGSTHAASGHPRKGAERTPRSAPRAAQSGRHARLARPHPGGLRVAEGRSGDASLTRAGDDGARGVLKSGPGSQSTERPPGSARDEKTV